LTRRETEKHASREAAHLDIENAVEAGQALLELVSRGSLPD
jgi:hypothetical protein